MAGRLFAEPDRRILWLTAGRIQIALSEAGVLIQRGRAEVQVFWPDIAQVQVSKVPLWPWRAWVDVFSTGTDHRVGPFPRSKADMWTAACGAAARDAGYQTGTLDGCTGFALRPSG